jgi:hypothetical protein
MRVRSRLVLGFCGLAMSVPGVSTVSAAPQDGQPYGPVPAAVAPSAGGAPVIYLQQSPNMGTAAGAMPPAGAMQPAMAMQPNMAVQPAAAAPTPAPAVAEHHHHGLLGRRHCVECQRARAKAEDGVDVPPPPGYPGGAGMPVAGGTIISGPVVLSEHVLAPGEVNAPGYAVVGGPESAAGYAVVNGGSGGSEPAPIGVARGGMNAPADPRMAAMARPGSYDPAVMPSSVPSAPAPMGGPGHDRPHILSHIFGLPKLGALHQKEVDKERAQHAAIAYGDQNQKVFELPASVVYGQK